MAAKFKHHLLHPVPHPGTGTTPQEPGLPPRVPCGNRDYSAGTGTTAYYSIMLIIINPVLSIRRFFNNPAIPQEYRRNFIHLYFDIAWFGILSGSAISFLNVYAARLGASGFQIGLLGAMPAVVSLFLSIPAGNWLQKRPVGKAVFWAAVLSRLGYFLWIPLPWLFGNQGQIWALAIITLAMGIPMCGLSVGFNALFAAAVPAEWRASVVGVRNVVLSLTFIIASLGTGYILDHLRFPLGYQVIFGIGFLSAAMSTFHLFFVRPHTEPVAAAVPDLNIVPDLEEKNHRPGLRTTLRLDIWRTPYRKILLVLLGFHLAQYLSVPLFALYSVNELHLTDANIGFGTALFYLTVLLGSTQLSRLEHKVGNHKLTGWGVVGMSIYPIALALSHNALQYYLLSITGGFAWALVGGAYANYLLERIPEDDRPSHLAWYNIILNAAVLIGSMAGPFLAGYIGIGVALIVFGALRLLAGIAILRWGNQ
ncbi:MAG: MFS transporter [Chloroflexi bacterium]|nr:MFS transporter [Chloroflexota bacterium]